MTGENMEIREIGEKLAALGMWKRAASCNWAVRPRGVAYPYFCTVMLPADEHDPKGPALLMLDGWETFHAFIHTSIDNNFGFYSQPCEMPLFRLQTGGSEPFRLYRHRPVYSARPANALERELCAKILWECYGVLLRLETERDLPMRYARQNAIFARVEDAGGNWRDEPLPIVQPRPHVERISILRTDIAKAKDVPMLNDESWAVDFHLVPGIVSAEPVPRMVYRFLIVDARTGGVLCRREMSADPERGLHVLWESLAQKLVSFFGKHGCVPGEIQVGSGRMFRMLRPICPELPVKLTLHDSLPVVEEAKRQISASPADPPALPPSQDVSR